MGYDRRSGSDRRRRDIGPPPGVAGRRRDDSQGTLSSVDANDLAIALKAIQAYAETHPRPSQVTQDQAAEMVGVSRATIHRMIRAGQIKLNKFGRIPIIEVDRALQVNS